MFTAATWFHRFFMRYSLEDYHRQDVAASCIFLATKTEECGRKLRDVARVCEAKIANKDVSSIPADGKEVEARQISILLTEEVLLEALCFDFVVDSPHADLVDLFDSHADDILVQEYAWSIAHDSYRTPLCLLYPPKIIATACYVLAQRIADGPHSASLDARISYSAPSSSLPTPPSHKPASPDASRFAIEFFSFTEPDLNSVADAVTTLVDFYAVQDGQDLHPHISVLQSVAPPNLPSTRTKLYHPPTRPDDNRHIAPSINSMHGQTPNSSHGGSTPAKTPSHGLVPAQGESPIKQRLDLS
jgi:hypothetical protein